jgi:hypothetical protein
MNLAWQQIIYSDIIQFKFESNSNQKKLKKV